MYYAGPLVHAVVCRLQQLLVLLCLLQLHVFAYTVIEYISQANLLSNCPDVLRTFSPNPNIA